jgi:subtilisin family serine protease
MPNFGINPDDPQSEQYRKLVESQGEMMLAVLELANEKNKVIFSAAGNDSSQLTNPVDAKYASPFNWAAITARERGIARNGVIVEAHDKSGKRATFSNEHGDISCPGQDILSAIAFAGNSGSIKQNAYGKMSGTSMASPYCAAAHSLFSLVRPEYSGVEIVDCMTNTDLVSDSGAPRLKLTTALEKCPKR